MTVFSGDSASKPAGSYLPVLPFASKLAARRWARGLRPAVGRRFDGSLAAIDFLSSLPDAGFSAPLRIASYQPLPGELQLSAFNNSGDWFYPFFNPDLGGEQKPLFHYPAQENLSAISPTDLDLDVIFLPALALDKSGTRLGQGGGWYDRALSTLMERNSPLLVVGCVPSVFLLPAGALSAESHDMRVDFLLSESGWERVSF